MQPVAAGLGIAVSAGVVAGQVDQDPGAARGGALTKLIATARDEHEGQRHGAVRGQVLGHRGARGEVVHVQRPAVVVGQPGGRPRLRDDGVDQPGRPREIMWVGGGEEDFTQPGPQRPHGLQVDLVEVVDLTHLMVIDKGAQRRDILKQILPGTLRGRVHQVDNRLESGGGVMTEIHQGRLLALRGRPGAGHAGGPAPKVNSAAR